MANWGMTLIIMLVITGGAAVFVAWPLLMGRTRPEEFFGEDSEESILERLVFHKDITNAALKELEFDRAQGNLSEKDFLELQERYSKRVATIEGWIQDARAGKLKSGALLDDEFSLSPVLDSGQRRRNGNAVEVDVEQEIDAFRQKSRQQRRSSQTAPRAPQTCASCGRIVKDRDAQFCAKCGARLR